MAAEAEGFKVTIYFGQGLLVGFLAGILTNRHKRP